MASPSNREWRFCWFWRTYGFRWASLAADGRVTNGFSSLVSDRNIRFFCVIFLHLTPKSVAHKLKGKSILKITSCSNSITKKTLRELRYRYALVTNNKRYGIWVSGFLCTIPFDLIFSRPYLHAETARKFYGDYSRYLVFSPEYFNLPGCIESHILEVQFFPRSIVWRWTKFAESAWSL